MSAPGLRRGVRGPGPRQLLVLDDGGARHHCLPRVEGAHVALTVTLPAHQMGTPSIAARSPPDAVPSALAAGRRWVGPDLDPEPRTVRARVRAVPTASSRLAARRRSCGAPHVFLSGELVLRKALEGVTAKEAARLARAWRPHPSLAILHLCTPDVVDPRRH